MALGKQRLAKIIGPAGFGALHLDQRGAHQIILGFGLTALDHIAKFGETAIDLFLVARVATEQKVIQIQTILHDLVTHGFRGSHILQCGRRFAAGPAGFPNRADIHQKQDEQNEPDPSKPSIQLRFDRHCVTSSAPLTTS